MHSIEEVEKIILELKEKIPQMQSQLNQAEGYKQALFDMQKAEEYLTKKGLASVEKRAGRATENGIVESYIHTGGRIGALVQLSCETDFVARTDEFSECAKEIAMQVAAMNPSSISKNIPKQIVWRDSTSPIITKPPSILSSGIVFLASKMLSHFGLDLRW